MIAQVELVATMPDGARRPVRVWIDAPKREAAEEWSCEAGLDGLHDELIAMHGGDSLQAICLALGLCATLLRDHVAAGGQLHFPGGDDVPLDAYFGWLGAFSPPS